MENMPFFISPPYQVLMITCSWPVSYTHLDLAGRFIKNFAKYEGNEHGKALVSAGPQL